MKKKILSLFINTVITLILPATILQPQVHAEGRPNLVSGIGEFIKDPYTETSTEGIAQVPQSYIYFGKDDSVNGIKWRVLSTNKDNARRPGAIFLLSEECLENSIILGNNKNWQKSNVKNWCTKFIKNIQHFNKPEYDAVRDITKTDKGGNYFDIQFGTSHLRNEKLFCLSAEELKDYIGNFDCASGLIANYKDATADWWIRSPSGLTNSFYHLGVVYSNGYVFNYYRRFSRFACRGALNINHKPIIFTSAAVGGKLSNTQGITGLQSVENTETTDWKLTLRDYNRTFTLNGDIDVNGKQITVPYKDAMTGENEYISAIIKDRNGNIIYYGRIMQLESNNQITGIVNIELPKDFDKENHTIHIFNEHCNGDKYTDYSSIPIKIILGGK